MANSFSLLIIIAITLTSVFLLFKEPILIAFGASEKTLSYGIDYISIYLLGTIFVQIALGMNSYINTQGFAKIGMMTVAIGALINIVLDPILIFGLNLGVKGAALATLTAQAVSAAWVLKFLFGNKSILKIRKKNLKLDKKIILSIVGLGMAPFIMQSTESLVLISLNTQLSKYGGDLALSAIGIVTSIQTLILMPITGLMQGQQPLISYNYGALKMERVKETLKYAIIGATMIAVIGFIAVQFFTKSIVYMFNDEADVVKLCSHALHIWFMCLPVIGAQVMCANYFQAIGKIKISSVLNLLRQIIILIPCIIIFSSIIGLDGIFIAVPVADLSAFIITVLLLKNALKKEA